MVILLPYCFIASTISFNQSTYHVNENDMTVEIAAILSNPSSTDITVEVGSNDDTANSEFTISYVVNTSQHITPLLCITSHMGCFCLT